MNNNLVKLNSEKSVLGAMLLSREALNKASDDLKIESFEVESHQLLFRALKDMSNQKIPIDVTTLTSFLQDRKELDIVGGVEYIVELLNKVPSAYNIDQYIKEVEDAAILRRLLYVSDEIKGLVYDTEKNIAEVLDQSEKKILDVSKKRRVSDVKHVTDVIKETEEHLIKLSKNKGEITGVASGFGMLDRLTTGFQGGEVIIIASRPGMGKTAFALNIANHAAIREQKTVAVFNLEMSASQLMGRMLASEGQIDGHKIATGNLSADDWRQVNQAMSKLSKGNMYIDDTPGITIEEIKAKCRRLASLEKGLDLIVIDYLQLISTATNYGSNRQQQVADISRQLKLMAIELDVPVIALAQLSRAVEQRGKGVDDKRPMLSDLRESGTIEQDADIVMFLFREDYYQNPGDADEKEKEREENTLSKTELIVKKHRKGGVGTINLVMNKKASTFSQRIT